MTKEKKLIEQCISFVKESLQQAEGGHDWFHSERVWKTALYLWEKEGRGKQQVIELAALLHDISDPKFNGGDEALGSQIAEDFLCSLQLPAEDIHHIGQIIRHLSFGGGKKQNEIDSIEFHIVQDADRLDAIGAIGIARTFNYGGHKGRAIHDPSIPLVKAYENSDSYRKSTAPTINHFYEKLLKLKDLMNTESGAELAAERHEYMLRFLNQFYREWDPGKPAIKAGD